MGRAEESGVGPQEEEQELERVAQGGGGQPNPGTRVESNMASTSNSMEMDSPSRLAVDQVWDQGDGGT